jgi:hypothetical protein
MLMTTPIRIAAATITRRRFCRMTLPVSVPVIMFEMHFAPQFLGGVDYLFTRVGWTVYSLYTFR